MQRPDIDKDTRSEARIDELETRLAQQDQSIVELSDEIYRHQQQIAQLELQLRHLADRLRVLAGPEPASDEKDEIPPHY